MRYGPDALHGEFGEAFRLVESTSETHHTPFGTEQKFIYCRLLAPDYGGNTTADISL